MCHTRTRAPTHTRSAPMQGESAALEGGMAAAIERRSPVLSRARQIDFSPAKPAAVAMPSPIRTQQPQAQHKGSFQVGCAAAAASRLASRSCLLEFVLMVCFTQSCLLTLRWGLQSIDSPRSSDSFGSARQQQPRRRDNARTSSSPSSPAIPSHSPPPPPLLTRNLVQSPAHSNALFSPVPVRGYASSPWVPASAVSYVGVSSPFTPEVSGFAPVASVTHYFQGAAYFPQ